MNAADTFNHSSFSRWINGRSGRLFRLTAGMVFLIVGIIFSNTPWGIASLIWSVFPLSAGAFDICYISAVLGGPLSGKTIRATQHRT
jgi:hypothetical protein